MRKRMLSIVMAMAMVLSLLPVTAIAAGSEEAYAALQTAIEAAPTNGTETTVTLTGDITGMTTNQILTIQKGQNVVLDMAEYSITVADDFEGRPFKIEGTLAVTGNGTVHTENAQNAYGVFDNYGSLTVENGTYRSYTYAGGSVIKNRPGSQCVINDGTFYGSPTAVFNEGITKIYNGTFDGRSCSACNSNWGYTIQSHWNDKTAEKPELYFYNGTVIGVQGAFSTSAGYSEVHNGTFETVGCENAKHGINSAWYALYVAGESGEVECNVYGGTFTAASKYAAYIGNSNDGGEKKDAIVNIHGGTFVSGRPDKEAVHVDNALGGLEVTGGRFSSNVTAYVAEGYQIAQHGDQWVVGSLDDVAVAQIVGGEKYPTLAEAVAAAKDGDTVKLLDNTTVKEQIIVNNKKVTLDTQGYSVVYTGTASDKNAIIDLSGASDVVITGNGTFTIDDDYLTHNNIGYTFRLYDTAKLTIEDGTYYAGLTCVQAGDSAAAYIHEGSFRASTGWNDTYWLLNLIDDSDAQIIVSGGTFENFDPANSKTENPIANFCAQGYATVKSTKDDVALYTVAPAAAEVNGKYYATLTEAVEAVVTSESKTGTVKLLRDATGGGVGLFNGKGATGVNLTIDFGGFTYTCADPAVGSVGTESQGFHLEQGNTVTLKNGTICVAEDSAKTLMLIQNYCDLTLENLDLYGSDITQYIISSNYGDMVLKNVGIDGTHSQLVAIDLMHWLGTAYANQAPTMEIRNDTGDAIVGKVDVYCYGAGADSCTEEPELAIYGGYFTSDPGPYVAEGKAALPSDNSAYAYMVGDKIDTEVEPAVGAPDVTMGDQIAAEDETTVKTAAESVTTSGELAAAANQAIGQVTEQQKADAETAIKNEDSGVTVGESTVKIYAQTYLDITPTGYDKTEGRQSLTLDITPMYRVVASTAEKAEDIKVVGEVASGETANAVVLEGSEKALTDIQNMTISITLPGEFPTDNLYVKHTKDGAFVGYHKAAVSGTTLTFTNDKGFSTFEIKVDSRTAVVDFGGETGQITYTPVNVGDTLPSATSAGQVFDGWTFAGIEGTYKTLTDELLDQLSTAYAGSGTAIVATAAFHTPSGGGGGGGVSSYAITVEESENGAVTADKRSAAEDAEITLTVKPNEGYVLESLTVTDKDGKEIALTDKGEGVYTFAMPASKVTVKATFAEAPVSSELPFTDVDVDDWFYGAVEYVYNNKLMDGTSSTTFSPLMTTTRSMIVTILWRLEGQPQVNYAMTFEDVAGDTWYTEAVRWAASEGIVKGYSDTVFAPDDIVSREQLATILDRYAQYKEYDVTAKGDLTTFVDGDTVSSWAADGMTWAVGAELITGKDGGKLDPTGTATRAEVATMLMRFCENVAK